MAILVLGIFKNRLYISQVMKTLVVHPADPTTAFLSRIYAHLNDKTVVTGGISKSGLRNLIESHDKLLFLGHGSPYGLLSKEQFPDAGLYIIDISMAPALKKKSNCMFIWCYADQFVHRHGLSGLCTGMFISEASEADYWGFENIEQGLIDQSNDGFASIISKYLNEPLEVLYYKLIREYELLSLTNQVAKFNLDRLNFSSETISFNSQATLESYLL